MSFVILYIVYTLCSSRKYPYSPHPGDWNFLEGGGSVRPKKNERNLWSLIGISRGLGGFGVLEKVPSVGEVWIFSGIIQYKKGICYIVKLQWNFDIMKGQRIGKVCLFKQGCVVSRFFSVWLTVTGAMKIFCYTEDFFIYRVHAEVC